MLSTGVPTVSYLNSHAAVEGSVFQAKTTLSGREKDWQTKLKGRGQELNGLVKLSVNPGTGLLLFCMAIVPAARPTERFDQLPVTKHAELTACSRIKT